MLHAKVAVGLWWGGGGGGGGDTCFPICCRQSQSVVIHAKVAFGWGGGWGVPVSLPGVDRSNQLSYMQNWSLGGGGGGGYLFPYMLSTEPVNYHTCKSGSWVLVVKWGWIPVSLSAIDRANQLSYMQKWFGGGGRGAGRGISVSLSVLSRQSQSIIIHAKVAVG